MTDAPITTGRRMWLLLRTLALPWVVCGGLLWALVGLTPDPPWPQRSMYLPGLSAAFNLAGDDPFIGPAGHPLLLVVTYHDRWFSGPWHHSSLQLAEARFELSWNAGPRGRFAYAGVGLWWLLPFPLLWSGFNLWRWARRGED